MYIELVADIFSLIGILFLGAVVLDKGIIWIMDEIS